MTPLFSYHLTVTSITTGETMKDYTHVELNAADGSLLIIETYVEDGELNIEVYRHRIDGQPILAGEFTAAASAHAAFLKNHEAQA